MGEAPALKAPSLPTKPLHVTSHINGREYAAAGQAVMAVTWDREVEELRHRFGSPCHKANMVATERHLWVNLADIGE